MRTVEEINQDLQDARQSYGETKAEMRNEWAMFGDSWPGSADQLRECVAVIAKYESELEVFNLSTKRGS
jgi:hypothetical protein